MSELKRIIFKRDTWILTIYPDYFFPCTKDRMRKFIRFLAQFEIEYEIDEVYHYLFEKIKEYEFRQNIDNKERKNFDKLLMNRQMMEERFSNVI